MRYPTQAVAAWLEREQRAQANDMERSESEDSEPPGRSEKKLAPGTVKAARRSRPALRARAAE